MDVNICVNEQRKSITSPFAFGWFFIAFSETWSQLGFFVFAPCLCMSIVLICFVKYFPCLDTMSSLRLGGFVLYDYKGLLKWEFLLQKTKLILNVSAGSEAKAGPKDVWY